MFKVNDYLEVKDIQIPAAYLEEFCEAFDVLLNNHAEQLVDVAVLSGINGQPINEVEQVWRDALGSIGFKLAGERMIRGGIVETQPRNLADRALFHNTTCTNRHGWRTSSSPSRGFEKSVTTSPSVDVLRSTAWT